MGRSKIFSQDNLIYWVYPLIMIDRFLYFLNYNVYLQWPIRILILYLTVNYFSHRKARTSSLSLIYIFIFYNFFSGLLFLFNDVPIQCYFLDVLYYMFPVCFFFIAASGRVDDERFYKSLMISFAFCIFIGLYMYFFAPSWYQSNLVRIKLMKSGLEYSEEHLMGVTRMGSFMASAYATSHYSIFLMIISASFFIFKKNYNSFLLGFFFIVGFLGSILCQQRVAMVFSLVIVLFFFVKGLKRSSKGVSFFGILLLLMLLLSAVISYLPQSRYQDITSMLNERIDVLSFNDAYSSRDDQRQVVLKNIKNILLGSGMGSGGTMARVMGYPGISDGNYHKILYETGIVGLVCFLTLMIRTLYLLYKKNANTELLMVLFILIAMTGSNSLCVSPIIIFPFWYAVGVAWRKKSFEIK